MVNLTRRWRQPRNLTTSSIFDGYVDLNKEWDELFDSLFYRWPKEAKPPIGAYSVYNENQTELIGVRIQMALAGFSKDDVKVWFDDEEGMLHISGTNMKKEKVLNRFRCEFDHSVPYASSLDVKHAQVELEDGMLDIYIPLIEKKAKKVFLFGQ